MGLEIGAIWAGLGWLTALLQLPAMVTGLILCAWPYLATGFLHLDGFMDVTDAVKSCRELARRREILKDSHVGAFAVIGCVLVLLAGFALFSSGSGDCRILLFVPAVSRCCSALAVTFLKPMATSQYAGHQLQKAHGWVLAGMLALAIAGGFLLCGRYGFALLGTLAGYGLALLRGFRSLEGMNGDVAGFCLTVGELCAAAVMAHLFPLEKKTRYQWQPQPGHGYAISENTYRELP